MVSKAQVKSVATSLDGKSGETDTWELRIDTGAPLTPISPPAGWDDVTDPHQPPVLHSHKQGFHQLGLSAEYHWDASTREETLLRPLLAACLRDKWHVLFQQRK